MQEMKPVISSTIKNGEAYYTLVWSPSKADKYEVTSRSRLLPVFELYRMDESKAQSSFSNPCLVRRLRSQIRAAIDPDATHDPVKRAELEDAELYYRYSMSESFPDILDVVWFLHTTYFPDDIRLEHSGRYSRMYLNEKAPDKNLLA